jgi:hypothetical protein
MSSVIDADLCPYGSVDDCPFAGDDKHLKYIHRAKCMYDSSIFPCPITTVNHFKVYCHPQQEQQEHQQQLERPQQLEYQQQYQQQQQQPQNQQQLERQQQLEQLGEVVELPCPYFEDPDGCPFGDATHVTKYSHVCPNGAYCGYYHNVHHRDGFTHECQHGNECRMLDSNHKYHQYHTAHHTHTFVRKHSN